ncbi:alpha/beta fold hydrolase [Spirosoma panaciterrae]|uniref:alpha/beta fold hydrolase n=1 Tax=Spirosoma panaciterrae TaxID=496058 RepID=UPI00037BBF2A|nr:alpha/beta hydrolase [Spirosoma panaciterrae]
MRSSHQRIVGFIFFLSALVACRCEAQINPKAEKGQVNVGNVTIAYESQGSYKAPVILLIAGTNMQLTGWPAGFCQQLVSRGYRVIRLDNRDVGLSSKFDQAGLPDWAAIGKALAEQKTPPLPYTLDDMAADAVGLLDALDIKKAHIVGVSMGGMIAQRVAYTYPEHTLSLTSIMAGGGKPTFPLVAKPELAGQIPPPGAASDTAAYIKREVQSMKILAGPVYPLTELQAQSRVQQAVQRAYYPEGLHRQGAASLVGFLSGRQEQLKTIKVPTLVIHGSEDPIVVVEAGRDVAASVPGAVFQLINGMGHDLPETLTSQLASLIIDNARKGKR